MNQDSESLMPPVGPYSPPEAIRNWLNELQAMPSTVDVKSLVDEANKWLEVQQSYISIA